jgi:hypothetical protein
MGKVEHLVCSTGPGGMIHIKFDNTGRVLFVDSYFTSVKIFKRLLEHRGIFAVGTCRHRKPAKNAGPDSFPLDELTKATAKLVKRGSSRTAVQSLGSAGSVYATYWQGTKVILVLVLVLFCFLDFVFLPSFFWI